MPVRIVLADDHRLIRDGLASLLAREPDLEVVGVAEDGLEACKRVRELQPDLLLTDQAMPGLNGVEVIRRVSKEYPGVKCLCLSMHKDSRIVMNVMDAGASGYVLKDCCFDEIHRAIRAIVAGKTYLSQDIVGVVVDEARRRSTEPVRPEPTRVLTRREREMVQLLSEGYSTTQIAERLHVSGKTVATHRENIQRKLNIHSIAELTRYAIREGISSLDVACAQRM